MKDIFLGETIILKEIQPLFKIQTILLLESFFNTGHFNESALDVQ